MIVRTAAVLSPEERAVAAERIVSQDPVPATGRPDYGTLMDAAEKAVGRTMDRTRRRESVLIRELVAYRMREDGHTLTDIARVIGVRHSTVVHYLRKMCDRFDVPACYADDLRMYAKFNNIIEGSHGEIQQP